MRLILVFIVTISCFLAALPPVWAANCGCGGSSYIVTFAPCTAIQRTEDTNFGRMAYMIPAGSSWYLKHHCDCEENEVEDLFCHYWSEVVQSTFMQSEFNQSGGCVWRVPDGYPGCLACYDETCAASGARITMPIEPQW